MVRITLLALAFAAGCRTASPPSSTPEAPTPAPKPAADLESLRAEIAEMVSKSAKLNQEALELFARGEYPAAEALHRQAFALARESEKAMRREEGFIREAARPLIADLDSEEIEVREAAAKALLELGAPAGRVLREMDTGLPPEASRRLQQVVRTLGESLWLRQWASGASASSQFSDPKWAAAQATGPPDTSEAGDCTTAWASKEQDAETEWIELTYPKAVHPAVIRIHETLNAGSVSKVEVRDPSGEWRVLWGGPAAPAETPRWFEVRVADPGWPTREVRLTLGSAAVPGWNEIDAVELLGRPPGEESRR